MKIGIILKSYLMIVYPLIWFAVPSITWNRYKRIWEKELKGEW